LLQHKLPVGLGFAALAVILALAATGWTRRKRWGWLLGVLILAVNLLSDTVSLIASRQPADLLGVAIGAAILTNPHLVAHPNSKVVLHLTNPTTPEWGAGCIRRSAQHQRNRHMNNITMPKPWGAAD
jgi:hypothetical protein